MRSARSSTTTSCPARVSCCAAASPDGPGTDHRHPLAGPHRRWLGHDPALVPRPVDDRHLDLLDRHRIGVDAEHAGGLARRRAQAAGELGEVVRRVQALHRIAPMVAVDEVVPVGDEVAEWAAVVAERDAAVHAATGLVFELLAAERLVHLLPVAQPDRDRTPYRRLPIPLQEPVASPIRLASSSALRFSSIGWFAAPGGADAHASDRLHHSGGGLVGREAVVLRLLHHAEHPLVVPRHDLHEPRRARAPSRRGGGGRPPTR